MKEEGMDLGVKAEKIKEFSGGARRSDSNGKGRFDLISPFGLKRLALRYEGGAIQKGERNWENGTPFSRCIESMERHINDIMSGDRIEDHLAAIAWQVFALMHYEELIKRGILSKELDDLPRNEEQNAKAGKRNL